MTNEYRIQPYVVNINHIAYLYYFFIDCFFLYLNAVFFIVCYIRLLFISINFYYFLFVFYIHFSGTFRKIAERDKSNVEWVLVWDEMGNAVHWLIAIAILMCLF